MAGGLFASACGSPSHKYIANGAEDLFFRVPNSWTIYRLSATDTDNRSAPLPSGFDRTWHVVADASATPTPEDAGNEAMPTAPVAVAEVWALNSSHNDQMSQTQMRRVLFGGFDPLLQDPGVPAEWEVVSATPLEFNKQVLGYRVVINQPTPIDPTKFRTISGSSLFDPATGRVYLLKVQCASECYKANVAAIDDVALSWTVNRK